jgi:hypothetical protein
VVAAVGLLAAAVPAARASADDGDSLAEKLKRQAELREDKAAQAAQVDLLEANKDQVGNAIDALQGSVGDQQGLLARARDRSAQADAALAQAKQAEAEQEQRLASTEDAARGFALRAYVSPSDELEAVLSAADGAAAYRAGLASLQAAQFTDALDELAAARADLETARQQASRAAERAEQRKADAATYLTSLERSLTRQQTAEDKLEARLDRELSEAAALETLDAKLAGEIRTEQAAIAARLAAARAAALQAAAASGIDLGSVGGGRAVVSPVGSISVTTVGGITVATRIAGQISALLRDAAGSGIILGGGGYRSPDAQVSVRRSNCGSSHYDIWQKPSSQCRPPAARPGQSMHERGEAIDFTCNGALISSRGNPCYRWLAANAGRYGLMGNSVEPWHWSTNGR